MTETSRPFAIVDVFSSTPYLGNPVAVILDAEGLDDAEMQRIARWTNLSETTFVFPPTAQDADYRVRIYTPDLELPFAGHPTLGAARAWLDHGGVSGNPVGVVQECKAGLVQVKAEDGLLFFAAPPTIRSGDLDRTYLAETSAALGLHSDQIVSHQWIDNGPGWAVIQVATAAEVLALEPDLSRIPDAMVGVLGAYPAGSPHRYELRTFAPKAGVPEDPACGSMNAAVAQWLIRTGEVAAPYRVSQGGRVHRAGDIAINVDAEGAIWVGGRARTLQRGLIMA